MTRRLVLAAALAATMAIAGEARAHEGHAHKIMGTVSVRHDNHLEVKATDGKTSAITLNAETKVRQGKAKATADDIRTGDRVVVTATETKGQDGKPLLVANEVRLGAAASARSSKE
jgi:hypothetical protein